MRKDTTFSENKLTSKEFNKKYWMNGKFPYQYHTAQIEDGRDEREQFIVNNIRALYNLRKTDKCQYRMNMGLFESKIGTLEKYIKIITAIAVTSTAISLIILILYFKVQI